LDGHCPIWLHFFGGICLPTVICGNGSIIHSMYYPLPFAGLGQHSKIRTTWNWKSWFTGDK